MANEALTALTAATSIGDTDVMYAVISSNSRQMTWGNVKVNLGYSSNLLKHEFGGLEADVSAFNGLVKISAGSTTQAVSGTDYAPATSGTSILKGDGSGGFGAASSGTDYAPATSGTAILKGNGSGGFSAAVSATDYAPATSGTSILKGNGSGGFSAATSGDADSLVSAASTTTAGKVEIATFAEVNTGTDAARAVSPDSLAGSYAGTAVIALLVFDDSQNTATGDGAGNVFVRIPSSMNGMNLVSVAATVQTAGTTGTTDVQIHNVTDAADMLTTKLTIDSGETDSSTAATAAVINTAADDVATGDVLRIDVDAVSTTPAKGLLVTMEFRLP